MVFSSFANNLNQFEFLQIDQAMNLECIFKVRKYKEIINSSNFHHFPHLMLAFLWLALLLSSSNSIQLDPINSTCISIQNIPNSQDASYYSFHNNSHVFKLPPFSEMLIEMDLRHIPSDINAPTPKFKFKVSITKTNSNEIISETIDFETSKSNIYSLFVTEEIQTNLFFEIDASYQAFTYLLEETVAVKIILGNYRVPSDTSSFLIIVQSKNRLNLPYNTPQIDPQFSGYFLKQVSNDHNTSRMTDIQTVTSYWSDMNSIALPYLPYFSNCKNQPDNIYINQMMEEEDDCDLVPTDQTEYIDQFNFGSLATADSCSIQRQCIYDEIPGMQTQFPYWPTLSSGSVLFSVTRNKIPYEQYQIDREFDETELVRCRINQSIGTNQTGQYPLKVLLNLEYYQQSAQVKTLIKCNIQYSLYVQSSQNFSYQLQIRTIPMSHTNIMLAFGFEWYVYMIVFVIIGALSNLENLILWFYHYLVSKKKQKLFRVKIYLRVIWQIGKGTLFGLFFFIILLFVVTIVMNGTIFDQTLYNTDSEFSHLPKVFWDSINSNYVEDYNSQSAVTLRAGRTGLTFLVIGAYIIFYASKYFIGCEKPSRKYQNYEILGRKFFPREYNRGKFLFGTFLFIFIQFIFIYFAYSKLYSANIWTFILLMKIIQIIMEEITKSVYEDILPCLPFKVITDITAYMNTLSANNFYDFLFSFLIDVAITMIEKAYVSQLQNIIVEKIQEKIDDFNTMYYNFIHDNETNEGFNSNNKAEEEQNEDDDSQNNQVVIVDYVNNAKHLSKSERGQIQFFQLQIKQNYRPQSCLKLQLSQNILLLQQQLHERLKHYKLHENKLIEKKALKNQASEPHKNHLTSKQNPDHKLENNQQELDEEAIQKSSSVFQLLLDNIVLVFTFFLQPFVILVYWITYDQSGILGNYGISSSVVILYILSAVVIAFFTIVNIILIFHLLECYLDIDFQTPIQSLLQRFGGRSIFWKASDEDINTGIGETLRGADHYCLSWQFFFILTVYISSMILVMLGVSILMNINYNPFEDMILFLVIPFWCILIHVSINIFQYIGYRCNLDGWSDFEEARPHSNAVGDISLKKDTKQLSNDINLVSLSEEGYTNHNLFEKQSMQDKQQKYSKTRTISNLSSKHQRKQFNTNPLLSQQIQQNLLDSSEDSDDDKEILETQLRTICQKLQKNFECSKFSQEYFLKEENKNHLRAKIWTILEEMEEELPELPEEETKIMMELENIAEMANHSELPNQKIEVTNKNYEPAVVDLVTKWKNKIDEDIKKRQSDGKSLQERVIECQYCYETWGLYFSSLTKNLNLTTQSSQQSYTHKKTKNKKGICLKCSKIITEQISSNK